MNVLVFSSVMKDSDFSSYQFDAKIKPNPSNQNFYSKLIKALSLNNNVSVISHRPFAKGMFKKNELDSDFADDGNVKFYYTNIKSSKSYKLLSERKQIVKSAKKAIEDLNSKDFIIVTDTLRLNLLKAAKIIAKKYNARVVGMLTDNPNNLSSGSPFVHSNLLKEAYTLDGYLALTSGLVSAFNPTKPAYIFEGLVVEEPEIKKDPIYNYFFFGGSLYERYGVKTLVDAFHESNIKAKLVIAGSGPLAKYVENMAEHDYRILYLSQISKEKNVSYIRNSIASINPRPLDKKIDNESVPSKLLEYLSLGVPVISTKFEKIYGPFKDDITWFEGDDVESMKKTLESFDLLKQEEYLKKAATARRKIFEFYGIDVQGESISHFLAAINSSAKR